MKALTVCLLTVTLSLCQQATADVVISEEKDNTLGKGIGGWTGVLIGGAAAGPAGALAAGFAGIWSGGEIQESIGKSGRAYRIERPDGTEKIVRSPKQIWYPGDTVKVVGNRLVRLPSKNHF